MSAMESAFADIQAPVSSPEVSFPANWRDLAGWQACGIEFSSPSDQAVKMYDALLHQAVYHYDEATFGGFAGTGKKMLEADPKFAMGNIFTLGIEALGTNPHLVTEPRKKLKDFSNSAKNMKLTNYEQKHLVATEKMVGEDYWGAMIDFENILAEYPRDPYSLHMAYFLALTIGQTKRLYETPNSVIKHYTPATPFYGHVHGKLCFGQSENGDYQASEINGRLALDHFRLDNWAHHALAHNFDETGRALQGRLFLDNSRSDWTRGTTFSHHIWWHTALFHIQLGEFEAALSLYDDKVGPMTLKEGASFGLSDGSSLLMRLTLEGVDIGDRAKEQARAWTNHDNDFVSLFYDGHNCFTTLLAGDRKACSRLKDNMREFIQSDRNGWNKDVTAKLGVPLMDGIQQFMDGEYSEAVTTLAEIMPELQQKIQGSRAQKDIFQQILLHAAVRSGQKKNLDLAVDILANKLKESKLEKHTPLNQRFIDRMISVHQTQG